MDVSALESLVVQNNDVLCHIYALLLFQTGCVVAVLVVILLYKFLRLFF